MAPTDGLPSEMTQTQTASISTKRWSATGVIKKVFPTKRDPYGFLRLLTPLEFRGQEAAFYYSDLTMPTEEREYIQPGLTMEFSIIIKPEDHMLSPVPFKAERIKPMDPVEQAGDVVRGPREHGKGIIVSLHYTSLNVHISVSSWSELCISQPEHGPLLPGDTVIVRLSWKEVLQAAMEKRSLVGDIVARLPNLPRTIRRRSLSNRQRSSLRDSEDSNETGKVDRTSAEATPPQAKEQEQADEKQTLEAHGGQVEEPIKESREQPLFKPVDREENERGASMAQTMHMSTVKPEVSRHRTSETNKYDDKVTDKDTDCQDIPFADRESRKRHADRLGDLPLERRRGRSCGSGHQAAMLNQAFFAEELVRPLHGLDTPDENHSCSRRVSSPLLESAVCAPTFHQYPAAAQPFMTYDNSAFNMPIMTQTGAWSQWSQAAPFRGAQPTYPSRMSLKDFLANGGKLI